MPLIGVVAAAVGLLVASSGAGAASDGAPLSAGDLRKSGTVGLDITCEPAVKEDFQTAVALLHSFFYEEARRRFEDILRRDPNCAMAWWGVAMTWYHPLWTPPNPHEMTRGIEAVDKAKAIGGKTDVERGLISAIDAYFRGEDTPSDGSAPLAQSCHGPREHGARAQAFERALGHIHEQYPDNLEVTVFHSLALLGTAPPTDKSYTNQLKATAILEPLFERNPEHPGIAHYIIHAYDYPPLAARALIAARQYGDIAPWVPHALHMPTHIYTRLGLWNESINGNLSAAAAARDYAARHDPGKMSTEELHALDYVVFAYLQTAQDQKAGEIVNYVRGITKIQDGNEFVSAYAIGAIPARYALERRRWKEASALDAPHAAFLTAYPFAVAHIEFARAVGAARSGDVAGARDAVARLAQLRQALTEPKFQWWTSQIEIQRLAAAGWLARAEGNDVEALRLFQDSAQLEDSAGTHPVTPGQILPAREQLGDLLLELQRPSEALVEYELSLQAFPNRLNSHYGAARAAELAGKPAVARQHYDRVIEMAGPGDGRREDIARARDFVAKQ